MSELTNEKMYLVSYSELRLLQNCKEDYDYGVADTIEQVNALIEETRGYNFGVCKADFVLDVLKSKIKEWSTK